MKNYELSVIIPLHNTDLTMFANCVKSLKNQELGFDKIELIVVMHNCNAETFEGVRNLLSGPENVMLLELNNEVRSPSSPRNYGIDKATGDYITFLDADDMLTPECLRLSLKYIKESGADVCHFRKKLLFETENPVFVNELELWDHTQETIVVDRNTWNEHELFAGAWGMSTGRLYRRKLLIDNNLKFDESIKFAEDYHFVIGVYAKADKICLAPQLIGYIYYVNGGSLVQTTSITEERLLDYVSGFKKVFDRGLEAGFWMSETMGSLMLIIINWMFGCKDLSDEGRKKLKELMEPYIRSFSPIPPSKQYTGGRNDRINTMLIKYILREEPPIYTFIERGDEGEGHTAIDKQKDALARIMRNGIKSDYSRHYGFTEIATIEEYQKRLPVSNYESYYPMIRLTFEMAERGIFTDNDIISYAVIDEKNNRIPITYKAIVPYIHGLRRLLGCCKTFVLSEALPFEGSKLTLDNKYTNSIFGIILKEYLAEAESFGCGYSSFTTPKEYLFPEKVCDMTIMRWVFALKDRDVETIFSPDSKTLSLRKKELKDNWQAICKEIEKSDVERANELRKIFESQEDISFNMLWHKLKMEICWDMEYYSDEYALYGKINEDGYIVLDLDNVFYEFYKPGEDVFYTVAGISKEEEYHVLISNLCGLYRFDTGLSVRCFDVNDQSVVVKII